MTNDEINQREWDNLQNWSCGIYRSRTDTRMMVPKRWGFGLTVNFGNRKGVILFLALLALPLAIFLGMVLGGVHFNRH